MVTTTHGEIDEALLHRIDEQVDEPNVYGTVVEYWMEVTEACAIEGHDVTGVFSDGKTRERVHRSVALTMKAMPV